MNSQKLITPGFCYVSIANFLLFFSFYALMPILPFYLSDTFNVSGSVIGTVLASYSVACIIIRPIAGYLLDTFRQRPLYLLGYFAFMSIFCGYAIASILGAFIIFRILHGLAFGLTTVSGNTIVTEIVPPGRIGEGLGYYGLANTLAMCIGPMSGLLMHSHFSYDEIFICTFFSCFLGFVMAAKVGIPEKKASHRTPFSFGNLFLLKGIWAAVALLLVSIPYGMTTAYIAVYAEEIAMPSNSGLFFTFMAAGLGISRLLSGKWVDRGGTTVLILTGLTLVVAGFLGLYCLKYLVGYKSAFIFYAYIGIAFIQGISFGALHPAFNTLFVKLAPKGKRGAATSTYLTSWDLGIGIGIYTGGYIAQAYDSFSTSYLIGGCFAALSILIFSIHRSLHSQYHNI